MKYYKCLDAESYNRSYLMADYIMSNIVYKESCKLKGRHEINYYVKEFPAEWLEVTKQEYINYKVSELKDMFYNKDICFEIEMNEYYITMFYNIIKYLFGYTKTYQDVTNLIEKLSLPTVYFAQTGDTYDFKAFGLYSSVRPFNLTQVNFKELINEIKEITNET